MSKIEFINQMEPWFGLEEQEALNKYMGEGGWVTEFKKTFEFQDLIKKYTVAKHCFVVNNGTISLTLMALRAANFLITLKKTPPLPGGGGEGTITSLIAKC